MQSRFFSEKSTFSHPSHFHLLPLGGQAYQFFLFVSCHLLFVIFYLLFVVYYSLFLFLIIYFECCHSETDFFGVEFACCWNELFFQNDLLLDIWFFFKYLLLLSSVCCFSSIFVFVSAFVILLLFFFFVSYFICFCFLYCIDLDSGVVTAKMS